MKNKFKLKCHFLRRKAKKRQKRQIAANFFSKMRSLGMGFFSPSAKELKYKPQEPSPSDRHEPREEPPNAHASLKTE